MEMQKYNSGPLRPLPKEEFLRLLAERDRPPAIGKAVMIFHGVHGNFTIIEIDDGMHRYIGVTKRMPTDKDGQTGMIVAATRAWKDYIGEDPGYCRPHTTSAKSQRRILNREFGRRLDAVKGMLNPLPRRSKLVEGILGYARKRFRSGKQVMHQDKYKSGL